MTELENLLDKARQLAEARKPQNSSICSSRSLDRQPMRDMCSSGLCDTDLGSNGATIGGDAIAEVCIRKPSAAVKRIVPIPTCVEISAVLQLRIP
jgi:hypothetical protein